jgi:hypothetical protein
MDSGDEDRARALVDLGVALVDAGLDVLQEHMQADEQLTKESVLMPGGTVGKHFRHVSSPFLVSADTLGYRDVPGVPRCAVKGGPDCSIGNRLRCPFA